MSHCLLALAVVLGTSYGTASAQFRLVQPFNPAPLYTPPLYTPLPHGGRFGPGPTGFSMTQWGSAPGYRSAPGSSGFTVLQGARPNNPPCGSAWESYYRHKGW